MPPGFIVHSVPSHPAERAKGMPRLGGLTTLSLSITSLFVAFRFEGSSSLTLSNTFVLAFEFCRGHAIVSG